VNVPLYNRCAEPEVASVHADAWARRRVERAFLFTSATRVPATAKRVLIVDDDQAICTAYYEILTAKGYATLTANSRAQALAVINSAEGPIDVLVLDIALPDADGAELAQEIVAKIGPRPTLYVSGWADDFWQLADAPGSWEVMQKPIPIDRLIAAIERLASRPASEPRDAPDRPTDK
jgi:DNA-binding NtrC family response regulator